MPSKKETLKFLKGSGLKTTGLYGSEKSVVQKQTARYTGLVNAYCRQFGDGDLGLFSTPGRTEIGGNHTDHNHGRVLAGAVDLDAVAVAAKKNTNDVVLYSAGYKKPFRISLDDLNTKQEEERTTAALIRGIARRFRDLGYRTGGFNAFVQSDVMVGSGLSSSAAIEVLIATIMNTFFNQGKIPLKTLALAGQYAENIYFYKPCGLMDQMTCATGGIVTIDFKDPEKPKVKKVNFDFSAQNYSLIVLDTGGNHADLTDDYASVPEEMRTVAKEIGGKFLRDCDRRRLIRDLPYLRKRVGDRAILRAFHFFDDNERVLDQVRALESGDFNGFLRLVSESGLSSFRWLQNIYTVKAPEDQGVTLALLLTERYIRETGKGACRVHGGGFAGTIQVFLPNENVPGYTKTMAPVFGKASIKRLSIRSLGTVHVNALV